MYDNFHVAPACHLMASAWRSGILNLSLIFHKNDQGVEAHLFLGILAYTLVNTIHFKLKASNILLDWQNIVRIMNMQKGGT